MEIVNKLKIKIQQHSSLEKIISNVGWLLFEKIFRMIVGLITGVWIARYLGPSEFGILNYVLALVEIFTIIAGLGLDGIVVRNIVQRPENRNEILGTSFVLKLLAGFVSAVLLNIIILMTSENTNIIYLTFIISVNLIVNSFTIIDYNFQAELKSKYTVFSYSIAFSITSILKIISILTSQPLIVFGCLNVVEVVLGSLGLILFYKKRQLRNWSFSFKMAKFLLRDSWPLLFSGLAVIIYMRIDQIMLGSLVNSEEVGLYSVAVKTAELWYFIPTSLVTSTFPSLINAKKESQEKYLKRLQNLYDIMALIGYAVAVPTIFLSDEIIKLLYGESYSKASLLLSLYILAGIFVNLGVARSSFLKIENWTKIHLISSLIGCLLNILLNMILIPHYGALGATIATLFSYWVQAHGVCFLIPKMLPTAKMLTKSLLIPIRFKDMVYWFRNSILK